MHDADQLGKDIANEVASIDIDIDIDFDFDIDIDIDIDFPLAELFSITIMGRHFLRLVCTLRFSSPCRSPVRSAALFFPGGLQVRVTEIPEH